MPYTRTIRPHEWDNEERKLSWTGCVAHVSVEGKNKECIYNVALKNIWKVEFKTYQIIEGIILKRILKKYIYRSYVKTGSESCPMIEFGTSSKTKTQVIATLTYCT